MPFPHGPMHALLSLPEFSSAGFVISKGRAKDGRPPSHTLHQAGCNRTGSRSFTVREAAVTDCPCTHDLSTPQLIAVNVARAAARDHGILDYGLDGAQNLLADIDQTPGVWHFNLGLASTEMIRGFPPAGLARRLAGELRDGWHPVGPAERGALTAFCDEVAADLQRRYDEFTALAAQVDLTHMWNRHLGSDDTTRLLTLSSTLTWGKSQVHGPWVSGMVESTLRLGALAWGKFPTGEYALVAEVPASSLPVLAGSVHDWMPLTDQHDPALADVLLNVAGASGVPERGSLAAAMSSLTAATAAPAA